MPQRNLILVGAVRGSSGFVPGVEYRSSEWSHEVPIHLITVVSRQDAYDRRPRSTGRSKSCSELDVFPWLSAKKACLRSTLRLLGRGFRSSNASSRSPMLITREHVSHQAFENSFRLPHRILNNVLSFYSTALDYYANATLS